MGTEEVVAEDEDEDEEEAAFLRVGPEEATVRFDELSRASALSLSLSLSRFLGKCNVMLCDAISGDFWVVLSLPFPREVWVEEELLGH